MFTKINFVSSIWASNIIIRPFSLDVHSIISTSRDCYLAVFCRTVTEKPFASQLRRPEFFNFTGAICFLQKNYLKFIHVQPSENLSSLSRVTETPCVYCDARQREWHNDNNKRI